MKRYILPAFFVIMLLVAYHVTIVQPQVASFETVQTIMNDVWYKTGHALQMSGVGAQGGGGGTWGSITGTLSSQTDLQTALNLKAPLASPTFTGTVAGVTKGHVGLGSVDNTSDASKWSATAILTNKQYVPRSATCVVTANHITPNADTMDVCKNYTFSAGLTIDNPSHTGSNPVDQQLMEFEFFTAAPQSLTWGSDYSPECTVALPQFTTGDGVNYNRYLFRYSTTSTKWCPIAILGPDSSGVTTLTSSVTYTCPVNAAQCEMRMTSAGGTGLAMAAPSGSPINGQMMMLAVMCDNTQALTWNATFIPNASFPASCANDITKWTAVGVRYSSFLGKWQWMATVN